MAADAPPRLRFRRDALDTPELAALIHEHVGEMHALTPAKSVHALDLGGLAGADITLWTAWVDDELYGCGALRELDPRHGEIKSMRTAGNHRNEGVGRAVLDHLLAQARARGYERVSLETGAAVEFAPAQRLYERAGFVRCGPFGDYREDPYSVFMTLRL